MVFLDFLSDTMEQSIQGQIEKAKSKFGMYSDWEIERILINDNPDNIPRGKEAAYLTLLERDSSFYNENYLLNLSVHCGGEISIFNTYQGLIDESIDWIKTNQTDDMLGYCEDTIRNYNDSKNNVILAIACWYILVENGMSHSDAAIKSLYQEYEKYPDLPNEMPYIREIRTKLYENEK